MIPLGVISQVKLGMIPHLLPSSSGQEAGGILPTFPHFEQLSSSFHSIPWLPGQPQYSACSLPGWLNEMKVLKVTSYPYMSTLCVSYLFRPTNLGRADPACLDQPSSLLQFFGLGGRGISTAAKNLNFAGEPHTFEGVLFYDLVLSVMIGRERGRLSIWRSVLDLKEMFLLLTSTERSGGWSNLESSSPSILFARKIFYGQELKLIPCRLSIFAINCTQHSTVKTTLYLCIIIKCHRMAGITYGDLVKVQNLDSGVSNAT